MTEIASSTGCRRHVGEHDHAVAIVGGGDRVEYLLAALLHVVVGADADGAHAGLRPDDMLGRRDEFLGEATVSNQNEPDH